MTPQEIEQRITDDFIERMLEDIPRRIQPMPPDGVGGSVRTAAREAHRAAYRREMRKKIIEQLSGAR